MSAVVLALGTNLGDREATLASAVGSLRAVDGLVVTAVSPLFATAPVGGPPQPEYLNAVVLADATLGPARLLAATQEIEALYGRERLVRWGPRTLDIDLVTYGDSASGDEVVQDDAALTLPHPRAHERAFVLAPWASVDPGARLRLPGGRLADVRQLLEQATDRCDVHVAGALA